VIKIKRLNIFIDESGDFGFVKGSSTLYAISFALHESSNSIENELEYLNEKLEQLSYNGMIHYKKAICGNGFFDALHQFGSGPTLVNYFRPSRISTLIVFLNLINYTLNFQKSIEFFENLQSFLC